MTKRILTVALVGTVFAMSGCKDREPLSPSSNEEPLFAHAPAAGFSYAFGEEAGAPSAIAKNGDQIDISLDVDLAPFTFHPKTIGGGGDFTINYATGGMTTGTWAATKLISFQSYGSTVDPDLGLVFGGTLHLHIALSTGEKAILRLTCTDFGNPPPGASQGMALQVAGDNHFTAVWPFPPSGPTQGFTFFVEN